MTYWKRGLFFISWWSSCGILHHIVDECSDVSDERTASIFRAVVVHMDAEVEATHSSIVLEHSFSTQSKNPKEDCQLIDNYCENCRTFIRTYVLFLFWILKIFNHLYVYAVMLHIMIPASILSQKHEDCLKRLSCHPSVVKLQMFADRNSYDLGCDVKGKVILLNMNFEDFLKGSDAISVGSQILILRKCNCSMFKFQRV